MEPLATFLVAHCINRRRFLQSSALAGQRVFLALQNGKALCFGKSE